MNCQKFRFVVLCCVFLVSFLATSVTSVDPERQYVNGGLNCVWCTLVAGLIEQLSEINNETITKSLERLCNYLPKEYRTYCKVFADFITPFIIEKFSEDDTPDTLCHKLTFCYTDKEQDTCRLFPPPKKSKNTKTDFLHRRRVSGIKRYIRPNQLGINICDLPGIREICKIVHKIFDQHDPGVDVDSDKFSTVQTFRGSSWRGKDCDDNNGYRHPGAIPINNDTEFDSNCNGIYGRDPTTGESYENLFCKDIPQHGVSILGDSVGAHFHIPAEWLTAKDLSEEIFQHLPFVLENEFDWPELSSSTGYMNSSYPDIIHGATDSIYLRARERNRCIHRDFQNIAVNGARSSNLIKNLNSLARNQTGDYPLLIIYALVGNDVCNGHPDTLDHMTKPEEMKLNVLQTLAYLDTVLPKGSHLLMSGLVDGRVLFNNLHDRIHPIGSYHQDVTYADVYTFLNCLQVSPCTGWLNTNETLRNLTSERAAELSGIVKEAAETMHTFFENFDISYIDCPISKIFDIWKQRGGQPWQLIEPVDGFHSNQIGQALTGMVTWEMIEKKFPEFLDPVNPNNVKIQSVFGDQGGYL